LKRSVRVLILIFIVSLFLQISLSAQYFGTIATLDKLDTTISMGIYDGTTLTFTEPFGVVGVNQNRTIPVDWVAIGVSYGDSGTYFPRSMYLALNEVDYQIYDSISTGNTLRAKADATTLDDLITIYVGLPFPLKAKLDNLITFQQRKTQTHNLKFSISLPEQLMPGRRITIAS
jgi:hypothetical protein